MNSKKAITLLVLLSMLLSMVPMSFGALTASLVVRERDDPVSAIAMAQVGDKLTLTGTGVTAGQNVEIYWDLVQPWDSAEHEGLLNASAAESSGDFDVWFKVPASTIGTHYVWAKDMDTGETDKVALEIYPSLDGDASSGLEGDKVVVDADGFNDEADVAFLMIDDDPAVPSRTALVGSYTGVTQTASLTYSFTLTHTLIRNGTVLMNDGADFWTDNGDGTLVGAGGVGGTGTIDYLTGEVELTYALAPALGALTVTAYDYYVNKPNEVFVFSSGVESDDFGSASKSCTIPDEATEMAYGSYRFVAYDGAGNNATDAFTIGAVITLDVDEGPVGTVVEIRGSGFDDLEKIGDVATDVLITGDGVADVQCVIVDMTAGGEVIDGTEFKIEIVIPSVDMDDYDTISVTDAIGKNTAEADFEVTGEAEIEISPEYGVQGTTISIEGFNFSAIDDEEIVLNLYVEGGGGAALVEIDTYDADNDGEFSDTFTVPARTSDTYTIKAEQTDWGIVAEADFRIGMMIVILSPESGPTGELVTITGTGFSENGDWNSTFGDLDLIDDGDVDANGNLGDPTIPTFYVPTVEPGVYTMTILDIDTEIEVEVDFTVTDKTMIELDPMQAPQDYNVSIAGKYFAADDNDAADVDLDWVIWNETEDWEMEVFYTTGAPALPVWNDAIVDDDGNITAWWKFNAPDATSDGDIQLDVGTYWINVTDSEDLFAQFEFNVVEKTVDIEPRKSVFRVGDTLAFNLESSFAQEDSYIKIWDPSGDLYWRTDDFTDVWLSVGTVELVPYYEQVAGGNPMTFLDDAPLGTWEWSWYDEDDDVVDEGTFTVEAAAADVIGEQVADLANDITDLADQLTDVSSEFDDVQSDIADVAAIAEQAVSAAQQAAEAVQTVAQTANQANTAAENAATAAEAARDAANSLTTLVYGAIGAALVAALAAIVSLMQISRRIAG
jgi:hypothetical protein